MTRERLKFANEAVAIQEWGSFLGENKTPVLLLLDDVWSHSLIEKFMHQAFSEERCDTTVELVDKLVESCQNHPLALKVIGALLIHEKFTVKEMKSLDAPFLLQTWFADEELEEQCSLPFNTDFGKKKKETYLLAVGYFRSGDYLKSATLVDTCLECELSFVIRHQAFSEERCDTTVELVDKLVESCQNHPLALKVIGELILEKSLDLFDEPEIKQCYLDLGLFPEDQRIAATTLMDMWVHLYNHDKEGSATLDKPFRLSTKNLATLLPIRKHLAAVANHCEEEVVMQHDMMRTLAILLISQGLVQHRERLILSPRGEAFPIFRKTIHARLLSISTDERFPLRWKRIKVPEVEVFVLNFMSKIHPLPKFMKKIKRLKVLIITNYGSDISELENFPAPKRLAGLISIRLDHVSLSSISTSILELVNLQKLSLIMCKIGNSFNEGYPCWYLLAYE
ncbi:probable disease resistance protein [Tanacetum coccineum]